MTKATKLYSNRIALVFDFDDTLVPDTVDSLLESCGIDSQAFRAEQIQPLIDNGWEPILARFYSLIQESKRRDRSDNITKDYIAKFGQELAPFDGVPGMFDRLRHCAKKILPDIEVEFYLITSGMVEYSRRVGACVGDEQRAARCQLGSSGIQRGFRTDAIAKISRREYVLPDRIAQAKR